MPLYIVQTRTTGPLVESEPIEAETKEHAIHQVLEAAPDGSDVHVVNAWEVAPPTQELPGGSTGATGATGPAAI